MAEFVDHYSVLGLPSGEEGAKLTLGEIKKAFRAQSLSRHPDKRPADPAATADFQRLLASYDALRHPSTRRLLDARLRLRCRRRKRDSASMRDSLAAILRRWRAESAKRRAESEACWAELRKCTDEREAEAERRMAKREASCEALARKYPFLKDLVPQCLERWRAESERRRAEFRKSVDEREAEWRRHWAEFEALYRGFVPNHS
ncbi:pre-mRNA-splicing factor cwf23-like [Ananas comosus]|uniref:Pre-mRNA-splicing factor cwf23-like n=1 Tax=Ananas comosus TaxID=4615 RepID=A0A6P5FG63_ANACO|nr:pre-mRNA-splicing factor cwf23-like [Ananas comosus]